MTEFRAALRTLAAFLAPVALATTAAAYPDNVRYGYASCSSCHISPTGGGLLTPYGRAASEDFLSTWTTKSEGNILHNALALPDWLLAGGEFRNLAFTRDDRVAKDKGIIPMQLELQGGVTYENRVTAVASAGLFDEDVQIRSAYALAQIGDHLFARVGRFFPAFGINTPEHTLVTRRGLGFDQGQESFNAEAGVIGATGEVIVDAILSPGDDDISSGDKGLSLRAAWYAGGRSQIGASLLAVKGTVWERTVPGLFVTTGLTQNVYVLAEIDQEQKKAVVGGDLSTRDHTRLVSASKVGWEFVKGLHALALYESSVTTHGTGDPRLWGAGPGLQWFPRPHFELLAEAERRLDETWSKTAGSLLTFVVHYNL